MMGSQQAICMHWHTCQRLFEGPFLERWGHCLPVWALLAPAGEQPSTPVSSRWDSCCTSGWEAEMSSDSTAGAPLQADSNAPEQTVAPCAASCLAVCNMRPRDLRRLADYGPKYVPLRLSEEDVCHRATGCLVHKSRQHALEWPLQAG